MAVWGGGAANSVGSCCFMWGSGKGSLIKRHLGKDLNAAVWAETFQVEGMVCVKALRQVCAW